MIRSFSGEILSRSQTNLQKLPQLGPPKVRLDDKLALLGKALHAGDDKVQLAELLHRVVDLARVDLAREPGVGELLAVVAEPPRQVAVRRQELVKLEFLQEHIFDTKIDTSLGLLFFWLCLLWFNSAEPQQAMPKQRKSKKSYNS